MLFITRKWDIYVLIQDLNTYAVIWSKKKTILVNMGGSNTFALTFDMVCVNIYLLVKVNISIFKVAAVSDA